MNQKHISVNIQIQRDPWRKVKKFQWQLINISLTSLSQAKHQRVILQLGQLDKLLLTRSTEGHFTYASLGKRCCTGLQEYGALSGCPSTSTCCLHTPRDYEPETDKISPNIPDHVVVKCWDHVQRFSFWRQLLIHDSLSVVWKHLRLRMCTQRGRPAPWWLCMVLSVCLCIRLRLWT